MLTLAAVAPLRAAHADSSFNSLVIGHVYVNDNTAGTNTVAAFDRHPDGSLTPVQGSPFPVGGAGLGAGLGSQGSLQVSPDGRFLLVVDAGSSQISVVRILGNGALQPVASSPVSSGGIEPISITIHDQIVYVATRGNSTGGANYTGFVLRPSGQLDPLPGSTVAIAGGAAADVGDVLFNGDGSRLAGTEVGTVAGTFLIDSFTVQDGLLKAATGSPFAAQGAGPFGSDFRPTNPSQLFVTNAHNGGTNLGTVSAFNDGPDGVLTSIGTSPYPDFQNAPCWLKVSPDGRFAFAVNTASESISRFAIGQDGTLSLLGSTPVNSLPGGAVVHATDPSFDPTGRYFYVTDGAGYISAFTVSDGNLTEIASSPIALPSTTPSSLVVIGGGFDDQGND
jgi:6-phosphogluconolactonase (cycloisomerase 2 family)